MSAPGSASHRRRPGTSTWAAPGPPCSIGCSHASTAATSSCASRTPTPSATAPEWVEGILSALGVAGHAPRRGPVPAVRRAGRSPGGHRRPLGCRGRCTPATAPAEEIDARRHGRRPDARLRRPLPGPGSRPRARRGAALPDPRRAAPPWSTTSSVATCRFPHRRHRRTSSASSRSASRCSCWPTRSTTGHGHHPRHPGRGPLPTTPKAILLWEALDEAARRLADAPVPVYAHLPLLVNEKRQKLSKRRDPVAVEIYRDEGYLPTAFRNYLALLGWSPPGEHEKVTSRAASSEFRLEDVQRSPAFFDVRSSRTQRRVHPGPAPSASSSRVADPGSAPVGGWARLADRHRAATPGRPGPASDSTRRLRAHGPASSRAGRHAGRGARMVDFLFLDDPPIDEDSWQKAIGGDQGPPRSSGRRSPLTPTASGTRDVAAPGHRAAR